jgi:hypothetical protein
MPPNCPETLAVKVTVAAKLEGFGDDVRVVDESAWPTVWLSAVDVLAVKFASPP